MQIIAVDPLVHRSLLRCTNFIMYLSKDRNAKGREGENRGKRGRETFGHWHVFTEKHVYHSLY